MSTHGPQIGDFVLDLIQAGGPPAETPPVETPGSQISAAIHDVIEEFVPPGPVEAPPGETPPVEIARVTDQRRDT
jgi:hypothetical protein